MSEFDPNGHVIQALDEYLKNTNPRFAVMINGEWGCGKTSFIKKYMRDSPARLAKISESQIEPPQFCHVSLFGLESVTEIDNAIFKELHPFWASDKIKVLGNAAGFILSKIPMLAGLPANAHNLEMIPELLEPFIRRAQNGIILILDDFERCKMDTYALLGYVNDQIENCNTHVIIVANSEKIGLPQGFSNPIGNKPIDGFLYDALDYFNVVKEKVVGQTLHIEPNFPEVLEYEIGSVDNEDIRGVFNNYRELILDIIKKSKYNNMRNINKFINEFQRLYYSLEDKYRNSPHINTLLKHCLIFSIETHTNKKKLDEAFPPSSHTWPLRSTLFSNRPESAAEKFYGQYSFEVNVLTPKFWHEFLVSGKIDTITLNQYFAESDRSEEEESLPIKIWDFQRLDETLVDESLPKIIHELQAGKYTHPGIFLHAIGLLFETARTTILDKDIAEIDALAKNALNDTHFIATSQFINDLFLYHGSLGYEYHARNVPEFGNLVAAIKNKILQESIKNKQNNLKNILLTIDISFDQSLHKLKEMTKNNDGFYASESYINEFADKLVNLNNAQLNEIFLPIIYLIRHQSHADTQHNIDINHWIDRLHNYIFNEKIYNLHPLKQRTLRYFLDELKKT